MIERNSPGAHILNLITAIPRGGGLSGEWIRDEPFRFAWDGHGRLTSAHAAGYRLIPDSTL